MKDISLLQGSRFLKDSWDDVEAHISKKLLFSLERVLRDADLSGRGVVGAARCVEPPIRAECIK